MLVCSDGYPEVLIGAADRGSLFLARFPSTLVPSIASVYPPHVFTAADAIRLLNATEARQPTAGESPYVTALREWSPSGWALLITIMGSGFGGYATTGAPNVTVGNRTCVLDVMTPASPPSSEFVLSSMTQFSSSRIVCAVAWDSSFAGGQVNVTTRSCVTATPSQTTAVSSGSVQPSAMGLRLPLLAAAVAPTVPAVPAVPTASNTSISNDTTTVQREVALVDKDAQTAGTVSAAVVVGSMAVSCVIAAVGPVGAQGRLPDMYLVVADETVVCFVFAVR